MHNWLPVMIFNTILSGSHSLDGIYQFYLFSFQPWEFIVQNYILEILVAMHWGKKADMKAVERNTVPWDHLSRTLSCLLCFLTKICMFIMKAIKSSLMFWRHFWKCIIIKTLHFTGIQYSITFFHVRTKFPCMFITQELSSSLILLNRFST